ncbi:sulfatase [Georgenia alba]|uniref:Sulfatase n=1 Tax=Georgenia alba TaxID=2233858 RepID=A0ABW2QBN9_9MICO
MAPDTTHQPPNVLFVMTDQQRFDTIGALGNDLIHTPNMDRLVARGATFTNAYSTCPVCVPARYTIRTGYEPPTTGLFANTEDPATHGRVAQQCGDFLPEAMRRRGYRTFGVGKFHTQPWDAPVGYDVQLHSEELYTTAGQRRGDAYASWIAAEHPEYDWVEALMGERTEMYYAPQMSPLPAALTVESWAADRAVELIERDDGRPFFGLVSFIGPHPPLAPPLPFNRLYDPDRMPPPQLGDIAVDHLDQHIPWMNHAVYAEDVSETAARVLKARYYGEITYIDQCLGRILDAVEAREDAENTVICFFSDHGDHMGDHHAWQKESFFEASTRIPFLLSWPARVPAGSTSDSLVCLTDLFGIATTAAGRPELRQGSDVLATLLDGAPGRETLFGYYGEPGTDQFKAMVRTGRHKLIWMANGGHHLLFDVAADPGELRPLQATEPEVAAHLLDLLRRHLAAHGVAAALADGELATFPYRVWPRERIHQFDRSRGVTGFPSHPRDVLAAVGP